MEPSTSAVASVTSVEPNITTTTTTTTSAVFPASLPAEDVCRIAAEVASLLRDTPSSSNPIVSSTAESAPGNPYLSLIKGTGSFPLMGMGLGEFKNAHEGVVA